MTRTAYLIGHDISHSLSPPIYRAAFGALGIDATYDLFDVEAQDLGLAEAALHKPDTIGANITMPHKFWAVSIADDIDDTARACGAANLLVVTSGRIQARNTDALAIAALLGEHGEHISRSLALLTGAGGAAVAGLWALTQVPPRELVIAARRPEAAEALAATARGALRSSVSISTRSLDQLDDSIGTVGVAIQATPLGMHDPNEDALARMTIPPDSLIYDLVYRREGYTALQRRALASGALVVDGAGHLFQQAMPTFQAFTGQEPPRSVMQEALMAQIGRAPLLWDRENS